MPLYRAELLAKKPLRYAALIHDVSQVLYLPFDWDDGSNARDRSGYNNHGVIYGATLVAGKIGMARSFDGVDDYVKLPKDIFDGLYTKGELTITAWINRKSITMDAVIVGIEGGWYEWAVWFEYYSKKISVTLSGDYHEGAESTTELTLGTWYFIAGRYDGAKQAIFVNGVKEKEVAVALYDITAVSRPSTIGRNIVAAGFYDGIIDEVHIYNRALSDDEIRMLMYRRW